LGKKGASAAGTRAKQRRATATYLVDVRKHTTTGDGSPNEQVQLLVTADSELQVSGRDTLDSKVLGGVTYGSACPERREVLGSSPASSKTSAVRYSMIAAT
jgi:hypothetical protein